MSAGRPTFSAMVLAFLLSACGAPAAAPASSAPGGPPSPAASAAASAASVAPASAASKPGLRKVRYGEVGIGLALNAAVDQGFFAEQGIELDRQRFDSAANMVAPLGAGQLDVGQGAISGGLWNAVGRGVVVKVVADTGHVDATPPGFPQQEFMVRKALYDSGKVKTVADVKGLKVGTGIRGTSTDFAIYKMLQKAGLSFNDIDQTPMQPLELGVALSNGKIDAAVLIQPAATKMLNEGQAVHLMFDYEAVPVNQALNLLYSPQFADSDLAVPFMTAIIKGSRLYNDAFFKKQAAARDKIFDAVVKYGPEKDRKVYESYTWFFAVDPDGKLNLASMQEQQEYFLQGGFQTSRLDLTKVIDTRFTEQAVARLGPYK